MKVLVIGAGLGGLTAGIALRRAGIEVEVHEAARQIERTGAGLTLGLGAQHVFSALGLQRDVAAHACPAGALPFLHWRSGAVLMGGRDSGDGLPDDGHTNIVRHIYRADLQDILGEALVRAGGTLVTAHRLVRFAQSGGAVTAHFANGTHASGDLLVGADGVRSAVRAALLPGDTPRFTGHIAYRFLAPRARVAQFLSHGRSAIFIGPGRTFNRYTMAQGRIANVAALVEVAEEVAEGWSIAAPVSELRAAFAGWHPDVTGLIEQAEAVNKWGLYDRALPHRWSQGKVILLGDAAHAMLPFLGMGAALAVEDGYVLARALALEPDIARALVRYEAARLSRAATVHRRSGEQGRVTQALNPDAFTLAAAPTNDRAMMEFDPVSAPI